VGYRQEINVGPSVENPKSILKQYSIIILLLKDQTDNYTIADITLDIDYKMSQEELMIIVDVQKECVTMMQLDITPTNTLQILVLQIHCICNTSICIKNTNTCEDTYT